MKLTITIPVSVNEYYRLDRPVEVNIPDEQMELIAQQIAKILRLRGVDVEGILSDDKEQG